MRILVGLLAMLFLSGCLMTRSEMKEQMTAAELKEKAAAQQRAEALSRVDNITEQSRELMGRIEALENKISRLEQEKQSDVSRKHESDQMLNARFKAFEEELQKMDAKINDVEAKAGSAKSAKATPGGKENHFAQGQAAYAQKEWKAAILSYQRYRDTNPKGKSYTEATYKIGMAFKELGMKDEARVFLQEAVDKAPKSSFGTKAGVALKKLK